MAFNGSGAIAGDGPQSKRLCTGKLEAIETGHNNNKVSTTPISTTNIPKTGLYVLRPFRRLQRSSGQDRAAQSGN